MADNTISDAGRRASRLSELFDREELARRRSAPSGGVSSLFRLAATLVKSSTPPGVTIPNARGRDCSKPQSSSLGSNYGFELNRPAGRLRCPFEPSQHCVQQPGAVAARAVPVARPDDGIRLLAVQVWCLGAGRRFPRRPRLEYLLLATNWCRERACPSRVQGELPSQLRDRGDGVESVTVQRH